MIKRIEFKLNLDDPEDAAIYRALHSSIKYRRAGAVIRAALNAHIVKPNTASQMASQNQNKRGEAS